ncbi:hypothetical protein CYMTET_49705 [Cymbomonas tetramitiformis]|uniref:Uncharacterized protein n=1 Tax=Cymbomonas tetramitiformis TaxID=36881 RepID=A0AAE0BPK8_9CHLO|nr:hypothetical protein CYMTET_49705 [Cymbomonas tetramitiformis]
MIQNKRSRSLSPRIRVLPCSNPASIQTVHCCDYDSSPESTPRSVPTSSPGAPKKKLRHKQQEVQALSVRDETIERCFIPKDQMHMISSCSKFVEQSRHRFLLRPKCPSCHLDINANSIQEDPNSCMVLKCTRCCNVFCGFCLTYSHKVAEVYYHAVQWCRQNPSRPLARLPPSISVQEHFERLILSRMNERSVYERPSPDVGGSVKMGNKEMVRSDIDSVSAQT